jgi:peptide/nickel transport system substrate-binding protein
VFTANDQYVLGRPRIDEIEVKFFPDPRVLAPSILSGVIHGTMSRGISIEQGVEIRDHWNEGRMEVRPNNSVVMFPQFLDPTPAVVRDVNFRRAMLHAIDRKQLSDTLTAGLSQPAESFIPPDDRVYKEIESYNVRYEFSPTRAAQLIEGLGYAKGSDGVYRDGAGQRLSVEVRATAGDENSEKSALAIGDYWQRIGVAAEPYLVPEQRQRDRELRATFPAFDIRNSPNEAGRLARFQTFQTPLPENRFIGDNNPRYMNPEFDRLVDRYFSTIPTRERNQALGEIMRHLTDQVIIMGLFYNMEPTLVSNRIKNLHARHLSGTQAWNAHEWDLS